MAVADLRMLTNLLLCISYSRTEPELKFNAPAIWPVYRGRLNDK